MALQKIRNYKTMTSIFICTTVASYGIAGSLNLTGKTMFPTGSLAFVGIIIAFTYALVYATVAITIRDEEWKTRNIIFMGLATVLVSFSSNLKLVTAGVISTFSLALFPILNAIYHLSERARELMEKMTNYEVTAVMSAILAATSIYDGVITIKMAVKSSYTPYAPVLFISSLLALIFGFIAVIRVIRDAHRVIEEIIRARGKKTSPKAYKALRYTVSGFKYAVMGLIGVFWILPFYWMLITSFKQKYTAFNGQWLPIPPTLQNYKVILFSTLPVFGNQQISFLVGHVIFCIGLGIALSAYVASKLMKRYESASKVFFWGIVAFVVLSAISIAGIYAPIKVFLRPLFTMPVGFSLFFINSVIVAGSITAIQLLTSILGGYAFAKKRFRSREQIFAFYLSMMMIPFPAVMVAQYLLILWMGKHINPNLGLNHYFAFIFPGIASAYSVFFMRQAFESVPDSIIEAAKIDGASELQILFKVVTPCVKASIVALALFIFQFNWGNYLWQLMVAFSPKMYTLPVALAYLQQQPQIVYERVMAGATISTLPLIAFFIGIQRYFAESIFGGAVKG